MRVLVLILVLLPAVATAAEVYRWVDNEGVVHYSDRPVEGAETVIIQEAQTFSAPAQRASSSTTATSGNEAAADQEAAPAYSNLEIVSPKQEEVFWNIGGELSVSLSARPRIRSGHTVFLILNGQEAEQLPRGRMQIRLSEVFRGTHTLHAEVRDSGGNTLATSDSVQFTVQQTSLQNPNNPNRPGGPG